AGQGELASARPVDRIVAIVGSKPILASQVEEQLVLAQAQGLKIPTDSAGRAAARRQVLRQMVDEELLVQQAERDTTIKVTDQEVQDQVEQTVQNVRKQFSSTSDFQAQLRAAQFFSEEEWRRWLADQQRRSSLQQRLLDQLRQKGKLRPIPPTAAQMRRFWEENRAQQPKRPAAISFRQIVVTAQADSGAKARARQLAESLVVVLRHGASFADVAKRYSADSTSREQGGELGWLRRDGDPAEGKVVPELPVSELPPDYARAIGGDTVPGLKSVFAVGVDSRRPKFVVFELMKRLPEGELTFDDVKDRIRENMGQQLAVQHYLEILRRTTYVDIRPRPRSPSASRGDRRRPARHRAGGGGEGPRARAARRGCDGAGERRAERSPRPPP